MFHVSYDGIYTCQIEDAPGLDHGFEGGGCIAMRLVRRHQVTENPLSQMATSLMMKMAVDLCKETALHELRAVISIKCAESVA